MCGVFTDTGSHMRDAPSVFQRTKLMRSYMPDSAHTSTQNNYNNPGSILLLINPSNSL